MVAGGLARTGIAEARRLGAEAVQVFVSNPRGWALAPGNPGEDEAFVAACATDRLPVYVHAPYLVNFGSPTPATLDKSVACLEHSLRRGRAIGARGVVVHAGSEVVGGSHRAAMAQVRRRLRPVVERLDAGDPDVLIELTAGGKGSLCAQPDGLPAYLDALDGHPKVGVCVDTCHAMAAGHDLAQPGALRSFLSAVARQAGKGRLRLVHANDSKDAAGSCRDRHANIGEGSIGLAAFAELFVHPATRGVPVLIETPGDDAARKRDVDRLKALRADERS